MLLAQNNTYSKDELEKMMTGMRAASDNFYYQAQKIGNHAFIEFTGLMNEYISICRLTLEAGGDFTEANVHGGKPLVAQGYQVDYLAEKFECIFGTTLKDEDFKNRFRKALGW